MTNRRIDNYKYTMVSGLIKTKSELHQLKAYIGLQIPYDNEDYENLKNELEKINEIIEEINELIEEYEL